MAGKGAPLCPLVSAVLARGVCAEIPFFQATKIEATKMLLFFRESVAIDILIKRVQP